MRPSGGPAPPVHSRAARRLGTGVLFPAVRRWLLVSVVVGTTGEATARGRGTEALGSNVSSCFPTPVDETPAAAEAAASGNGSEKGFEYHCRRANLATAGTLHYHHNLFSDSRQEKAAATSSRRAFPETQIGNESRKRRFGSVFEAGPGRLLLIGFLENVRVEPGHGVIVGVAASRRHQRSGRSRMAPHGPACPAFHPIVKSGWSKLSFYAVGAARWD